MINRVVMVGRLAEDPVVRKTSGGAPQAVLTLDVQHQRWGGADPEVTCVEVHAFGEGLTAVLGKYLERGRDLLIEGYLRREGEDLVVVLERFNFLERGLRSRSLWAEAGAPAEGVAA